MILCSITRVLLAIFTKWPTKLTQTIDQTRTYYKQEIWNPDGTTIDRIPWKKVFTDGIPQLFSNQKKFPIKFLRLALFTVGKVSQKKYPVKRFNHSRFVE